MVKKAISIFFIVEGIILFTYLISSSVFANVQVAYLSAFVIILGSSYAYKKMVCSQVSSETFEEDRDLLDTIEDPHELYDDVEINEADAKDLDLKEIVKQERAKIKTLSLKSMKHGARGSVSLFRIVPYIFLILGFIALKNNKILDIAVYLPSLLLGIIVASVVSKSLFKSESSED